MALLDKISGGLLRTLSGTGSSSSSSVTSSLNGKGTGASFDKSGVDVTVGLNKVLSAFQASAIRITRPLAVFQSARDTLDQLLKLADHMVGLAKQASDIQTTDDQRGNLSSAFNRDAKSFRTLLDSTSKEDFDLRTKSDLQAVLSDAGIDTSFSSRLADLFSALAKSDGELGYTHLKNDDVSVTTISGNVVTLPAGGSTDPLTQDLTTQAGAQAAFQTLTKLRDDVAADDKNVRGIIGELVGAGNFAIAGAKESAVLTSGAGSLYSPDEAAEKLVSFIRTSTGDALVAAHSDIDRTLAAALLTDPNK